MAGLGAARRLVQRKLKVAVVEARTRAGGRLCSDTPAGWPAEIELGAEFIHSGNQALTTLLREAGVKSRTVGEQHWLIRDGIRREMNDAWDRIDKVMQSIGARERGCFTRWLKKARAKISPDDEALALEFVRGFQGAPPERMSAKILYEASLESDEQFRPDGRYDRLIDVLSEAFVRKGGTLHLGQTVKTIEWTRGHARVVTAKKEWRARAVLVTLPLGVLKAKPGERGAIRFVPRLGGKERLLRGVESGHARRIVLRLRADIWRRGPFPEGMRKRAGKAFGFLHSEEKFFPVWWAEAPAPILVGWTGGPAAREMAGWHDQKVFRAALATLARLLKCETGALEKVILDGKTYDWAADPLTRGAYSYAVAGRESWPAKLAKPVGGTLFFAGEATADVLELGTVHGALQSGLRAADEIEAALKRRR